MHARMEFTPNDGATKHMIESALSDTLYRPISIVASHREKRLALGKYNLESGVSLINLNFSSASLSKTNGVE